MSRRPCNVNQADVQRVIRACQRENHPFRMTLLPDGPVVFETANVLLQDTPPAATDDLAEDL